MDPNIDGINYMHSTLNHIVIHCANRIKKKLFIHLYRKLLDKMKNLTVNCYQTEHGYKQNVITDSNENTLDLIIQCDIYDTCKLIEKESKLKTNKLKELVFYENALCLIDIKLEKHSETLQLRSILGLTANVLMYNDCAYENKELFLSSKNGKENEYEKYVMEHILNK